MTIQHTLFIVLFILMAISFVFGIVQVKRHGRSRYWTFLPCLVIFIIYVVWLVQPGPLFPYTFR